MSTSDGTEFMPLYGTAPPPLTFARADGADRDPTYEQWATDVIATRRDRIVDALGRFHDPTGLNMDRVTGHLEGIGVAPSDVLVIDETYYRAVGATIRYVGWQNMSAHEIREQGGMTDAAAGVGVVLRNDKREKHDGTVTTESLIVSAHTKLRRRGSRVVYDDRDVQQPDHVRFDNGIAQADGRGMLFEEAIGDVQAALYRQEVTGHVNGIVDDSERIKYTPLYAQKRLKGRMGEPKDYFTGLIAEVPSVFVNDTTDKKHAPHLPLSVYPALGLYTVLRARGLELQTALLAVDHNDPATLEPVDALLAPPREPGHDPGYLKELLMRRQWGKRAAFMQSYLQSIILAA